MAAHWYNLGATDYRLGAPVQASAEWRHALRLAPRTASIRRALQLTPSPDPVSARRLWTAPFTPSEAALAALLLWIVAWVGLFVATCAGLTVAVDRNCVALLLGGDRPLAQALERQPVALVRESVPIRVSPHGRGSPLATLDEGQAVIPVSGQRGWLLVRDPMGRLGWVPSSAIVPVDPK